MTLFYDYSFKNEQSKNVHLCKINILVSVLVKGTYVIKCSVILNKEDGTGEWNVLIHFEKNTGLDTEKC